MKSIEELQTEYLSLDGDDLDKAFYRGAITYALATLHGLKPPAIASMLGRSAETIRKQVATFRAFAEEPTRVGFLSWRHHELAAQTDRPLEVIDWPISRAGEFDKPKRVGEHEILSTRQFRELLEREGLLSRRAKTEQDQAKQEKILRLFEELPVERQEAVRAVISREVGEFTAGREGNP